MNRPSILTDAPFAVVLTTVHWPVEPNATACCCDTVVFPDALLAQIPDHAVRKHVSAGSAFRNSKSPLALSMNYESSEEEDP